MEREEHTVLKHYSLTQRMTKERQRRPNGRELEEAAGRSGQKKKPIIQRQWDHTLTHIHTLILKTQQKPVTSSVL